MRNLQLKGLLPATVTPFDPSGRVDEVSLRRYMNWLARQGVAGVVVNADTGEGPHLWPEERMRIVSIVRDELGGRIPVITGLVAEFNDQGIKLAEEFARAGADAIMVFPLPAFRGTPLPASLPVTYYRQVAEASGLPLIAFRLVEVLGGVEYAPEVMEQILLLDSVVAVKDATFDARKFADTLRVVRKVKESKELTLLTGNDPFILESLLMGAEGALIGFGTVAVSEQAEMVKAVLDGDIPTAKKIYNRVFPLEEVVFAPPVRNYRARLKVSLKALGVINHTVMRAPLMEVSAEEAAQTIEALRRAGLLT